MQTNLSDTFDMILFMHSDKYLENSLKKKPYYVNSKAWMILKLDQYGSGPSLFLRLIGLSALNSMSLNGTDVEKVFAVPAQSMPGWLVDSF